MYLSIQKPVAAQLCSAHHTSLKACAQVSRKPSLHSEINSLKLKAILFTLAMLQEHTHTPTHTPRAHPWMDINKVSEFLILSYKARSESHWQANGSSSQQLGSPTLTSAPPIVKLTNSYSSF